MSPLDQAVRDAVTSALTPEYVDAKVKEHVDKLIGSAIREALETYSETGKTIRAAVVDSLRVNKLDLPSYGHVVAGLVERQIQARVSEVVGAKLAQDLEELLTLAPKRIRLSELVTELLGKDEDPCSCDGPDRVYCKVEWSEYHGVTVYLSKETPRHPREADIEIYVSLPRKADDYKPGEVPEGAISFGRVKGSDLKRDVRFGYGTEYAKQGTQFGRWFGFEQKILAMYAVGTIIEVDEDAVVTSKWGD